ncbi:MAG: hypothetical protein MZV70_11660 [Desulfobacterales bacterium]|nr:hypothetical protein [Desulfobacterales bacterium]
MERYENALGAVIRDEGVDGALVILTPQSMTDVLGTAEAIARIARRSFKPILCCFMGVIDVSAGRASTFRTTASRSTSSRRTRPRPSGRSTGTPTGSTASTWPQYQLTFDRERAARIIQDCLARGKTRLGELDGIGILESYGFKVLPDAAGRPATTRPPRSPPRWDFRW